MVEPAFNLKTLPVRLFALEIVPTYLIYRLFWLIKPSWYDVELVVYDGCVVFASLYVLPACLDYSPAVLSGRIGRTVSVKTSVLKLLFVLWNSSEEDNFFLIDGKSMAVPRRWAIGWVRFDLAPFSFRVLIEVLFDSIMKWAGAGNPSINVDCIIVLAIGHVIAWTAWRVVNVGRQNFGWYLLVDGCIVPRFRIFGDVNLAMFENFVRQDILLQLDLLLIWTQSPLLGLLWTFYVLVLFYISVKFLHHGLVCSHFCPQRLKMVDLLFLIQFHSSINTF